MYNSDYTMNTPRQRAHSNYIRQPHTCIYVIDNDRLYIQNKRLKERLAFVQGANDKLCHRLMIKNISEIRSYKGKRRKPKTEQLPTAKRTKWHYVALSEKEVVCKLTNIYSSLKSLSDIVELEHQTHMPCLLKNEKFKRIVELIPTVKELIKMTGLVDVKLKIFEMICFYTQVRPTASNDELFHIVIEGPPGVGKTELGKLIGKLALRLGVLKNDSFICARRSDLIGEYLGHTAVKTQKVIDRAIGGVLFIDEAYSLGHDDRRDSFSKECIDTLTQNLSEKKGSFLCIVAGYRDELESCFFSMNAGLSRRFQTRMSITGYSHRELFEIFQSKIQDGGWRIAGEALEIKKLFEEKYKYFYYYGGDIDTLFTKSKFIAAIRLMRASLTYGEISNVFETADIYTAYQNCFGMRERDDTVSDLQMYA